MKNICVYGASSTAADEIYYKEATLLGELLAEHGYGLVFGAGDTGVMGAVARGVHKAGGKVTGIIPGFMNRGDIPYKHCDELIVTETMRERKQLLEEKSDGFIAAPGGVGTFEELMEVITLKQLKRHKKPIAILNTKSYYHHMIEMLEYSVNARFMKEEGLSVYEVVTSPSEAVEYIKHYTYRPIGDKWF